MTGTTSNCTDAVNCKLNQDININFASVYNENGYGDFTTAVSLAPGKPATAGARYFSTSFTNNSTPELGITLNPTLATTGGVYRVYHVFSSAAGNVSTNVVLGVTNLEGCTLSFTNTDKFQSKYGVSSGGMNVWQFLGFLTNARTEGELDVAGFGVMPDVCPHVVQVKKGSPADIAGVRPGDLVYSVDHGQLRVANDLENRAPVVLVKLVLVKRLPGVAQRIVHVNEHLAFFTVIGPIKQHPAGEVFRDVGSGIKVVPELQQLNAVRLVEAPGAKREVESPVAHRH